MELFYNFSSIIKSVRGKENLAVLFLEDSNTDSATINLCKSYLERGMDINLFSSDNLDRALSELIKIRGLEQCLVIKSNMLLRQSKMQLLNQLDKLGSLTILCPQIVNNRGEREFYQNVFAVNLNKYKETKTLNFEDSDILDISMFLNLDTDNEAQYARSLEVLKSDLSASQENFYVFSNNNYGNWLAQFPKADRFMRLDGITFLGNEIIEDLLLAHYYDVDERTVLYFYGSQIQNAFRKYMIETWDGQNFLSFLDDASKLFNLNNHTIFRWGQGDAKEAWHTVQRHIGSTASWLHFWNKFKSCKAKYFRLEDIFSADPTNVDSVISTLTEGERSVISLGKTYAALRTHYGQTEMNIKLNFNALLQKILTQSTGTILYGLDPFTNAFFGHRVAKTYHSYTMMSDPRKIKWTRI